MSTLNSVTWAPNNPGSRRRRVQSSTRFFCDDVECVIPVVSRLAWRSLRALFYKPCKLVYIEK